MHWWVVAIRATYDVDAQGKLELAEEQLPPLLAPEYFGDAGQSSLRQDSDLLEAKPGTDVLVHGSAIAPRGRPAESVLVNLRLGPIDKRIVVFGDRVYYEGALGQSTTSPKPFVDKAIRYESAFGGGDVSDPDPAKWTLDERNPVGLGFGTTQANTPAHSIEYASGRPNAAGPAGFGPIDRGWLPRRTLAGTYDAAWVEGRKPLLPADYDPAFALSAPADQRTPVPLQGGERMAVSNMTPESMLVVELPRKQFALSTRFGAKEQPHAAKMTTVLLETDERRLSLVWQSSLRVRAPEVDHLDETTIEELPA
ncbi:MAG: DUF2169 domain-containing protein [Myxococcota bacterium]